MFRAFSTADGAVVETEVRFVQDGEERLFRDLHVLQLRDGRIVKQVSYCSGRWEAAVIRAQALEAPTVRP
jgi:ketosteroid isomerase-like protein